MVTFIFIFIQRDLKSFVTARVEFFKTESLTFDIKRRHIKIFSITLKKNPYKI